MNENSKSPQVGVGAVVFKSDKVLLVKRAKPPAEGLWTIPGGKLEWGETLQEASERELLEETGVRCRATKPVYIFDSITTDSAGTLQHHYVIIDFEAEYISGDPEARDDALEARWIGPEELSTIPVHERTLDLLQSVYGFHS